MAEPAGDRLEGVLGQRERLCFTPWGVRSPTSSNERPNHLQRDQAVLVAELSTLLFAEAKPLITAPNDVGENLLEGRRSRHLGATASREYYV
jgi:hypothetical protein